ncbi:VOC family protein [Rhodococcus sp. UNC23MFCrub1.1]|uniref:VOC family protein n=1 Tax=Rhodococcus sp. UNC23MFCrub1.1 TaxID=1449068 RepID=UPI000B0A5A08|nr:VOC family protein [Rhodococcus sp. UNC23MFCrub1.1]
MRPHVHLSGQLICRDDAESAVVSECLPRHVELTRAEPGCVSFDVQQSDDPLVWQVDEYFTDDAAFARHQERVSSSEWGGRTAGIERRYVVERERDVAPTTRGPLRTAGISLDCADPEELVRFYLALLGGRRLWGDDQESGMRTDEGLVLVAQKVEEYTPPEWPGTAVVHLDIDAGNDLAGAVRYAETCGARQSESQVDSRWAVLLDPAGHPFCITTMVWSDR